MSTFSAGSGMTRLVNVANGSAIAQRPPTGGDRLDAGQRRGSVTTPAIADAAAVSGEARNVRPPLPWRPSKFRFDVLIAYWPG